VPTAGFIVSLITYYLIYDVWCQNSESPRRTCFATGNGVAIKAYKTTFDEILLIIGYDKVNKWVKWRQVGILNTKFRKLVTLNRNYDGSINLHLYFYVKVILICFNRMNIYRRSCSEVQIFLLIWDI